ncbi:unnamed protein product [Malus baccata var. baccata]
MEVVEVMVRRRINIMCLQETKWVGLKAKDLENSRQELINVISVYAPQVGLDTSLKEKFWEDLEDLVQGIAQTEKVFIGGDLNGHVGKETGNYGSFHGGHGFGERNKDGEAILDFAMAYDLFLANTFFKKRENI